MDMLEEMQREGARAVKQQDEPLLRLDQIAAREIIEKALQGRPLFCGQQLFAIKRQGEFAVAAISSSDG